MSDPKELSREIQSQIASAPIVIFHSALTDVRSLKQWLTQLGLDFRLIEMPMADQVQRQQFQDLSRTYQWQRLPMIFMDGRFIGGEAELRHALFDSDDEKSRWMAWLGYGGLIPIALGALMLMTGPQSWRHLIQSLMVGYGAVILSFVGAIHWGWVLEGEMEAGRVRRHLLWSVIPALLAWPTLIAPFQVAAIFQAMLFLLAWRIDLACYPDSVGLRFFRRLRTHLTLGFVFCLLLGSTWGWVTG